MPKPNFVSSGFVGLLLLTALPSHADNSRVHPVYTPIPLAGSLPVPPDKLRSSGPYVVPMTGAWKFAVTRGQTIWGTYVSAAALAKMVTASSTSGGSGYWSGLIANAVDGDSGTHWSPSRDATLPQWIQLDLGASRTVAGMHLEWGNPRMLCNYRIEGSLDGQTWTLLSDQTADGSTGAPGGDIAFAAADARYVRVTFTGVSMKARKGRGEGDGGRERGPLSPQVGEIGVTIVENGIKKAWAPAPTQDGFEAAGFSDGKWDTVKVPSNWEPAGYSRPTYDDVDDTVGEYRRWVDVPAGFAGKKIAWRFDGVFDSAEIFVNGKRAGYHESGYTAFDVDLTGLAVPGKRNLFAVRVCKKTSTVDCDTGDYEGLGGIYRQTFLYATPQERIVDLTVRTALDAKNVDAKLSAELRIGGAGGANHPIRVALFDGDGRFVQSATVTGVGTDGSITITLPIIHPKLWSAEKPNVYYLTASIGNPKSPIETVEQRFGFRQITISPKQVVLWNSVPIKCAGTCRHEIYPTLGAALNDYVWKKDIALMKAANINAIRTSHYNHASRFLDLCEETGFYILDEIPYCWINEKVDDPRYKPALLERAEETFARDKNRPEVLAWSCGNENGGGADTVAVVQWMHAHDPTRPAFSSGQWPSLPGQSFLDTHYPKPADFDHILKDAAGKTPIVFTEQPHMFSAPSSLDYDYGLHEFWGTLLQKSWETIEKQPTILGSFIWEWQNQPVLSNWSDTAPNHRGKPTLMFENYKGVVDGYRNPKPEWWAVKMVYSPVQIPIRTAEIRNGTISIPVENRYSFTDLRELTCRWESLKDGRAVLSGTMRVNCPPSSSTTITAPVANGTTDVRLRFLRPSTSSDIYSAVIHVAGAPYPKPPVGSATGGPLSIQDGAGDLTVSGNGSSVVFNKQTGKITSWILDGREVATAGPSLNLGQLHQPADQYGMNSKGFIGPDNGFVLGKATVAEEQAAGGHVDVTAKSPITADDGSTLAELTVAYDVSPEAEIGVHWTVDWSAADARAWEAGLTVDLPAAFTKMSWLRDTPFSDYPAAYVGAPSGVCKPGDLGFAASKRSLHWMTLTDASGHGIGLLATPDDPLLARAKVGANGITLFASRDEAVDVELSSAWVADHDITLTKDKPLTGSFVLRGF